MTLNNITAFLVLSVAISVIVTGESSKANDQRYWVSRAFNEAPNVNMASNIYAHIYGGVPDFTPKVLSLDALDWSHSRDGDVRLCFDNRPLHQVLRNIDEEKVEFEEYCPLFKYSGSSGETAQFYSNDEEIDAITKGVLIKRNRDGSITCQAAFTQLSYLSFLSYRFSAEAVPIEKMKIPIGFSGPVLYWNDNTLEHINGDDVLKSSSGISGDKIYDVIDMRKSWACLLPAYRVYWNDVLAQCSSGVSEMNKNSDVKERYRPILKGVADEMLKMTVNCIKKP